MFIVKIISSRRDVGKTLFTERLVRRLADNGIRVVALKHIHHGRLDVDKSKDTERIFLAGSQVSIGYAGDVSMILMRGVTLDSILSLAYSVEPDVIVIEGFKGMGPEAFTVFIAGVGDVDACKSMGGDLATSMDPGVVEELKEAGCKAMGFDEAVDYVFSLALESL